MNFSDRYLETRSFMGFIQFEKACSEQQLDRQDRKYSHVDTYHSPGFIVQQIDENWRFGNVGELGTAQFVRQSNKGNWKYGYAPEIGDI